MDNNNTHTTGSTLSIEAKIEGFLFWRSEAVSIDNLVATLGIPKEDIFNHLNTLAESLKGRGIQLIQTPETVELRTAPELGAMIEILTKEELDKELGKAGLETLSIVLYEGPISRRDIDYIRGVNSQFILRSLMVRGLVERIEAKDRRSFVYRATVELLSHLGITRVDDLPEYASYRASLANIILKKDTEQPQGTETTA